MKNKLLGVQQKSRSLRPAFWFALASGHHYLSSGFNHVPKGPESRLLPAGGS